MKDENTKALLGSWEHYESPVLRRLFWYHQGRLRWTGQTHPDNTVSLLDALERNLAKEDPEVQWAMNLTAGSIGVHDTSHRTRCIKLGEKWGCTTMNRWHRTVRRTICRSLFALRRPSGRNLRRRSRH
tara:strand:+ start:295 stop:678 length:384 start_codon:yes stop_codon:yes gene_type:complete